MRRRYSAFLFFVTCFCDSLLLKHRVEAAARLVKSIDHAGSSTTNYCGHHLNSQTALDLYRNAFFVINLVKVSLPHVLGVIYFPCVANAKCVFATAYHLHVFFFFLTSIYLDVSNPNPYSCCCSIKLCFKASPAALTICVIWTLHGIWGLNHVLRLVFGSR